jgi:6-phospho-beta-glucosidase
MRLVVLGGSGSSTPELADALAAWPGGLDRRPELEIVLVGRDAAKLELVAGEFRSRAGHAGPALAVSTRTDRARALDGADIILNQVRVGGLDARAFDETFPWEFDVPGEETMGPGGFANASRTVPAQAATWNDVVEHCPSALVVNLTNPAGIVQQAAQAGWPGLRIVSVCDAPAAFIRAVADRLGKAAEDVARRYIGLNHCGWYVPEEAAELQPLADLVSGMDPDVVDAHQALPTPYVRYYVDPARQLEAQRGRESRAQQLKAIDAALLAAYAAGPSDSRERRGAVWYSLVVTPLIDGWLHGSATPLVLGVRNDGRVPEVPASTMIEVAHRLRPGRLEPLEAPARPAIPSLLMARHGAYEALAAQAVAAGAAPGCGIRALLANPMVDSLPRAAALLAAIEARSPRG